MKKGLPGGPLVVTTESELNKEARTMLHAGLDLSRRKIDVFLLSDEGVFARGCAQKGSAAPAVGLTVGSPVRRRRPRYAAGCGVCQINLLLAA
jgi:hypothetical protein